MAAGALAVVNEAAGDYKPFNPADAFLASQNGSSELIITGWGYPAHPVPGPARSRTTAGWLDRDRRAVAAALTTEDPVDREMGARVVEAQGLYEKLRHRPDLAAPAVANLAVQLALRTEWRELRRQEVVRLIQNLQLNGHRLFVPVGNLAGDPSSITRVALLNSVGVTDAQEGPYLQPLVRGPKWEQPGGSMPPGSVHQVHHAITSIR